MHSVMPRLMLAQRGSAWPQSQHPSLPAMAWTLWREPSPFSDFSLDSWLDSGLPVEGGRLLSTCRRGRRKTLGLALLGPQPHSRPSMAWLASCQARAGADRCTREPPGRSRSSS